MNAKTLIKLLPVLSLALIPVKATAATAYATVSANIVPAVTVFMPGSVILAQAPQGLSVEHKDSISLNTVAAEKSAEDAPKFNIKSTGKFTYSMTVSTQVAASNKSGNKISISNFRLPISSDYITSESDHALHMAGDLDKATQSKSGSYTGQVYLTANFN